MTACLIALDAWCAEPVVRFSISAGPIEQTIWQFARQSGVIIFCPPGGDIPEGVRTNAVEGVLTASQALERMLAGTALVFDSRGGRWFSIRRAQLPAALRASGNMLVTDTRLHDAREPQSTGTHIRTAQDLASPLQVIGIQTLKNTSYATVQDAMRELGLTLGAAPSEVYGGGGNSNRGAALNLRGLGAEATLVLIDGRRQAYGGVNADFVDVSSIPWSAVERVEVLSDGASALYGSDAVAGVVNIVMRTHLQGGESRLRFATAANGAAETTAAQLFGGDWGYGRWLFAYQYSKRTALRAADRSYTANTDKTPFGGSNHSSYLSNVGNIVDPITWAPVFALPLGQDGTSLTPDRLEPGVVNLQNTFAALDLLPGKQMHSVFLTLSQRVGERLELFGETRFSRRDSLWRGPADERLLMVPQSNPFFLDAFGNSPYVIVGYNFFDDLGAYIGSGDTQNMAGTLGLEIDLDRRWRITASTSGAQERLRYAGHNRADTVALNAALADPNPLTAFNPFGDGSFTNPETLAAIRSVQRDRVLSQSAVVSAIADGPLFAAPQGEVSMAVGSEWRLEFLSRRFSSTAGSRYAQWFEREVSASFVEVSVPLIGTPGDRRAAPRLELSLAGRYEAFSDFGRTFNPKIGLRWTPWAPLILRASWGTSFRAPKLVDLYDRSQNAAGLLVLPDPKSASGRSMVLVLQGSNHALSQETARTSTVGMDLVPASIPGLELSLTGYVIDYDSQVVQPGGLDPREILTQEDRWGFAVERNPSRKRIEEICNRPDLIGSWFQCLASSPAAVIDFRLRNLAVTRMTGMDVRLDYTRTARPGRFDFEFDARPVFSFEQRATASSRAVEISNTVGNPPALRLRGTAAWSRRGADRPGPRIDLTVNYTGSYSDPESDVHPEVSGWATADLRLSYRTARGSGWQRSLDVSLQAANLFDSAPPFVDRNYGYDIFNAEPLGRVIGVYVQKNWER